MAKLTKMRLKDLFAALLEAEGLSATDFKIVVRPFNDKTGKRRAKKDSVSIVVWDYADLASMPKARTLGTLIDKLYDLAPQIRAWTEGKPSYVVRVIDLSKPRRRLEETVKTKDLRARVEERHNDMEYEAANAVHHALDLAERVYTPEVIKRQVKGILSARYG